MTRIDRFAKKLTTWYFTKSVLPYWTVLIADTLIVYISCVCSYWMIYHTPALMANRGVVFWTSLAYALLSWIGARIFKTYVTVLRYSSFIDLLRILYANLVTCFLSVVVCILSEREGLMELAALSHSGILIAFTIATVIMWGLRTLAKLLFDVTNENEHALRVLVYGTEASALGVAQYARSLQPVRFDVRGFVLIGEGSMSMRLQNQNVYTLEDNLPMILRRDRIQGVLVSPQQINEFRNNTQLQDLFIDAGCKVFFSHTASEAKIHKGELKPGKSPEQQFLLKEVSMEDLLPRSEIRIDMESVRELLSGRRVLITGSGGSIGQEIVRQVAQFAPARMMLIDQAETPQHDVSLMMKKEFPDVPYDILVASVTSRLKMDTIFQIFQPEYVFHAAAYKHVPMMEGNPCEAVLNNVCGTKNLADMSVKYGVKKFVMVSTDKAVNPTNIMGCSKRICEIYVQSLDRKLKLNAMSGWDWKDASHEYTQFVTTRFGNVLGSNGSVFPLFQKQIAEGGPVTVTDKRVVRYIMLIPEACRLVLEAGTKGQGGEIFVFDMGAPVKIDDLARRMIRLSGAQNIKIEYTGLRPGEKLYEEMLNDQENSRPTFHEKIRIAQVREYDFDEVSKEIDDLIAIASRLEPLPVVKKMKELVPEFKSTNPEYENL